MYNSPPVNLIAAIKQRWVSLPANARGAVWIMLTVVVTTVLMIFVKLVGRTIPTVELVFFRSLVGTCLVLPFALRMGRRAFATTHLRMHLFRALLTGLSMMAFYYSFANLPLADATAMIFTMPLFLIILAAIFLDERVRWRRTTATMVGFLGVLIVAQPGRAAFDPTILIALSIGLLDASVAVVVKKLARIENLVTILLYLSIFITLASSIPAYLVWQQPSAFELGLLVTIAVLTTLIQLFSMLAWRTAEATAVAPFMYTQLIFAGIAGYLIFSEAVALWTGAGAITIAASNLYILRREAKLRAGLPTARSGRA